MQILGLGLNMTGELLFPPLEEKDLLDSLQGALDRNAPELRQQSMLTTRGLSFRGEAERRVRDAGDPRDAGWTFMVAESDPQRAEIVDIMRPLALHRAMEDPSLPLVFDGKSEDCWGEWLQDHYWARQLAGKKVPKYVLMVGKPTHLPFKFHSLMDTIASVGRVDFDTLEDLDTYVHKVIRLETMAQPVVQRAVIVFGTDGGPNDPTHYSRKYMADPLATHIKEKLAFNVTSLMATDATKANLYATLLDTQPALVYTVSHGLGLVGKPLADQKYFNGAICCQTAGHLTQGDLFCADDVPTDRPFLEGAVFFEFSCFGGGTPAKSDYAHWLKGVPATYADEDFIAALPKKLLAHSRGPVAFVGHLDTAWMRGFTNPADPHIQGRWHARLAPFLRAVEELLSVQPTALAMQDMNSRYTSMNALLTNTYDRQQRGNFKWTDEVAAQFLDTWIIRSDAQNYMVLGDPAVRLRIPLP